MVSYACAFSQSELGKYFEWNNNACYVVTNFKRVMVKRHGQLVEYGAE